MVFSPLVNAAGDMSRTSGFSDQWLARKNQPLNEPKSKLNASKVLKKQGSKTEKRESIASAVDETSRLFILGRV